MFSIYIFNLYTKDEMVGWHHWHNGHKFEQTPGDSEGQERLIHFSPQSCKELDMTATLQQQILYMCVKSGLYTYN